MKNQKGNIALIAIIVAIVAISASAITWLFFSQLRTPIQKEVATQMAAPTQETQSQANNQETSSVPADWKTYRNDEYGFEIKYPKEWKEPIDTIVAGIDLGCSEDELCHLRLSIDQATNPEKFLSEEFPPMNGKERSEVVYKQMENIRNASFISTNDHSESTRYSVFFGNKYYVTFSDYLLSYQENGIFDKIISSFKFTNEKSEPRKETEAGNARKLQSKGVKIGEISFYEQSVVYSILEATRYRSENPVESFSYLYVEQPDSNGIMRSQAYDIPVGKSIIAVKVSIDNTKKPKSPLSYSIPEYPVIQVEYTTPAIRERFEKIKTEPIAIVPLDIPPGQKYEYTFLFYAEYEADRAWVTYNNGIGNAGGGMLVDFNMDGWSD